MSVPAISVRDLSKCYRLGVIGRHTLVEETTYWWHRICGRDPGKEMGPVGYSATDARRVEAQREGANEFWALRDISFDVRAGEVVGIIGKNGAGKSTLLKILTRITEPTNGEAVINGRVGSLLEVGTGFHPDLTGRENVYMNGTILGMKKVEIDKRFDEIVAFAELETFLDTPVKRYSSGMYVRLAFAVAAHLDPEILLVDEVLAVGDIGFQKKCLGKMGEVASQGRTILFVSHNMSAINRLCSRAILLEGGCAVRDGKAIDVTGFYLSGSAENSVGRTWAHDSAPGTDELRLMGVKLYNSKGICASAVDVTEEARIRIQYHLGRANLRFRCVAIFYTQGICAFAALEPTETVREKKGSYCSEVIIPPNLLSEGEYTVGVSIFTSVGLKQHYVMIKDAMFFQVFDSMIRQSARGDYAQNLAGVVRPLLKWNMYYEGQDRMTEEHMSSQRLNK